MITVFAGWKVLSATRATMAATSGAARPSPSAIRTPAHACVKRGQRLAADQDRGRVEAQPQEGLALGQRSRVLGNQEVQPAVLAHGRFQRCADGLRPGRIAG